MDIFSNTWVDQWQVLFIPVLVLIITQFIKVGLEARGPEKFIWKNLNNYGGMPSTHTSFFTATALIIGLTQGFDSALFALAFVSGVTVVRDAVGIRFQLGYHGKILNHLIDTLPAETQKDFPEHLQDRLGHTPKEAGVGFLCGVVFTLLLSWMW